MKIIIFIFFAVITLFGLGSCKKSKPQDNVNEEPSLTSIQIGNKTYPVVTIGSQLWTAENFSGEGGVYSAIDGQVQTDWGKYYTIEEAKAVALPAGWRLPSEADIKKLLESQGARLTLWNTSNGAGGEIRDRNMINGLVSTKWSGSNSSNSTGFNALPAACLDQDNILFGGGEDAAFWTSSKLTTGNFPVYFTIDYSEERNIAWYGSWGATLNGFKMNIRFVRDAK